VLGICAAAGLAGGLALEPFVPTVKRLWTPSFTLFSAGWVIVVLMAFYWIVEVRKLTGWAFHCIVFGMNSIFAYSIGPIGLKGWLNRGLGAFTFHFKFMGDLGAMPQQMLVMGCIWGTCYWLYKRGIFLSCDSYEVHRVPVGYRASDPCRSDWRVGPHACR
jgi:predicted acyltransferase